MLRNRYHSRSAKRRPIADINIVPYIDVMLVLLMVFMISTPLLTQGVHVQLPKAQAKKMTILDQKPIVVTVSRSGAYYLNIAKKPKQTLTADQLSNAVGIALGRAKQDHVSRKIYVRGDRHASYGDIVKAMVVLQKAGAEHVGLVTQPG